MQENCKPKNISGLRICFFLIKKTNKLLTSQKEHKIRSKRGDTANDITKDRL